MRRVGSRGGVDGELLQRVRPDGGVQLLAASAEADKGDPLVEQLRSGETEGDRGSESGEEAGGEGSE